MPHEPNRRRRRLWGPGTTLVIVLLLGACATLPPPPPLEALWLDGAYRAPIAPLPTPEDLFALSGPMERFLAAELDGRPERLDPRVALVQALHRPDDSGQRGLQLAYEATRTRTPAEAFEARSGNCLSLVMMTAAFARRLGLQVGYQAVHTEAHYTRSGSLTMASGHVNLVLGVRAAHHMPHRFGPDPLVIDFLSPAELRGYRAAPLTEATIVAMYFNNRAAELLADGEVDAAYWHARTALRHDPGFLPAINTLGVIHQRAGHADSAERAFRQVVARDDAATAALGNLVGLLKGQGRTAEASEWARQLEALQPVPPFHWLRLGREALAAGDAARAVTLLRRELRRQADQDEVHFALAEAYLQLGDLAQAQMHLTEAAEHSTRRADRQRYASKLNHLRAALAPTATP